MPVLRSAAEQAGKRVISAGPAGQLRGLRVLVVEDVAVLAWQVRDVLLEAGAEVVGPVPNVSRALAALGEHAVDAAVLDMNLDGESADPVADDLVARRVPFLFLTGYGSGDTAGRHAAVPTLGKPLRPKMLVQALSDLAAGWPSGPG